jgi:hypothetical protein
MPLPPPLPQPSPVEPPAPAAPPTIDGDVTAELAAERAQQTQSFASAATELIALADEARPRWSDDERRAFDKRVAELRRDVTAADDGRPRQRAYRALVRYLQRAVVRDDAILASRGAP